MKQLQINIWMAETVSRKNGSMRPAAQWHVHAGQSQSVFSFIVSTDNSIDLADERSGQIQFRFVCRGYLVSAPEFADAGSLFEEAGSPG